MNIRLVLGTTTAIGVLMAASVALADSNVSALQQDGNGNNALITQSGASNRAGIPDYGFGLEYGYGMNQIGNSNNLTIKQTGNSNNIGANSQVPSVHGDKLTQDGNSNTATLTQNAGTAWEGNTLGGLWQENNGNHLTLTQTYQDQVAPAAFSTQNGVGEIYQAGSDALTLTQTEIAYAGNDGYYGNPGFNLGNTVTRSNQGGVGDSATVAQYGILNYLGTLNQTGNSDTANVTQRTVGTVLTSLTQNGNSDQATVSLLGNFDGADSGIPTNYWGDYTPYGHGYHASGFSGAALSAGVGEAVIDQEGNGNILSYVSPGTDNAYGLAQNGSSNVLDGYASGNFNQAAVAETGDGNFVNFSQYSSSNNLGISILGNSNNYRNWFSGGTPAGSIGLTPGYVTQEGGDGNSIQLTVGDISDSNSNLFAFRQNGAGNTIVGSISGGNGNQVAVSQTGSSNSYTFNQIGSGNNIGVSQ